jgi:hypothetical protein
LHHLTQASSFRMYHFLFMCGVPSTAVFCRESTERFPHTVTRYFLVLYLQFQWSQWLPVWQTIWYSIFSEFI